MRIDRWFVAAVIWLAAASSGTEARGQAAGTPRKWAHESSTIDLPVDPRIHFSALPSGMRVAWR